MNIVYYASDLTCSHMVPGVAKQPFTAKRTMWMSASAAENNAAFLTSSTLVSQKKRRIGMMMPIPLKIFMFVGCGRLDTGIPAQVSSSSLNSDSTMQVSRGLLVTDLVIFNQGTRMTPELPPSHNFYSSPTGVDTFEHLHGGSSTYYARTHDTPTTIRYLVH
ncbi:hypothetical protein TNCV_1956681 [Trichonephila clavipes]|nr:hypothetical protein TNCV_1956681 [Trichonephila clavipes]